MTDLTRKRKFNEKKTLSTAAARVKHTDVADTTSHELFNLPPNAVIIDAMVNVEVAGQGSLTVDFGFSGGDELGDALAIDATGVKTTALDIAALTLTEGAPNTLDSGTVTPAPRLATGTGKNVTAKFSADPSAGEFVFIVTFIEYDLGCGDLLDYTA